MIVTNSPAPLATIPACDAPHVSVIFVTYGTGQIVVNALATLASTMPGGVAYEAIVVDNPHRSHAGRSLRWLALATAGVRVLQPGRNLGFGGGCNAGVAVARGEVIVFANPDIEFREGWLVPLLDTLEAADVFVAAPVLLNPDGSVQEAGVWIRDDGWAHFNLDAPDAGASIDVVHASAASWVLRRDALTQLGGFDDAYWPAYYEDIDLVFRARDHGLRVVVHGSSRVVHHMGQSVPDRPLNIEPQRDEFLRRYPAATTTRP
ncbi:MAG TPA: glycosyltransferase family 2 protein [Ilumatobacter sp.]|nr:glycosyltransferase family 2 protein [Ilumatobacter sp.]